jgi:hypothetical protein
MADELVIAGAVVAMFGICFGIFWRIVNQMNSGCHKRIDRMETDLSAADDHCMTRIQDHTSGVTSRVDDLKLDMHSQFTSLTTRIDALLLHFKNGTQ